MPCITVPAKNLTTIYKSLGYQVGHAGLDFFIVLISYSPLNDSSLIFMIYTLTTRHLLVMIQIQYKISDIRHYGLWVGNTESYIIHTVRLDLKNQNQKIKNIGPILRRFYDLFRCNNEIQLPGVRILTSAHYSFSRRDRMFGRTSRTCDNCLPDHLSLQSCFYPECSGPRFLSRANSASSLA